MLCWGGLFPDGLLSPVIVTAIRGQFQLLKLSPLHIDGASLQKSATFHFLFHPSPQLVTPEQVIAAPSDIPTLALKYRAVPSRRRQYCGRTRQSAGRAVRHVLGASCMNFGAFCLAR